jgi:hypothetical protein
MSIVLTAIINRNRLMIRLPVLLHYSPPSSYNPHQPIVVDVTLLAVIQRNPSHITTLINLERLMSLPQHSPRSPLRPYNPHQLFEVDVMAMIINDCATTSLDCASANLLFTSRSSMRQVL